MVTINPVGIQAPVSNIFSCLVTYTEVLPHFYPSSSKDSIEYITGTPLFDKETVFIPITAIITLITKDNNIAKFTESFIIAFQEQEELPSRIIVTSVGRMSQTDTLYHGVTNEYKIHDSLEIIIA